MASVMHVVLFKLRDGLDEKKLEELIHNARQGISGLLELHFGANNMYIHKDKVILADGNTHALVSRHEEEKALEKYLSHPLRQQLARYILAHAERAPTVVNFNTTVKSHL
ncbi:hypothetical protein DQ04_04561050 [Trypanosoma grayi]|uniref:hypothetical protein n=1 Tax=Trypanosoma grayi TaxID=71804 RepID=UPI0004F42E48|nr:hypothetical protein DQ04_04561050 [Trypanosoma grayi]KEG09837.1 hypothetical protein DQ04_04561050 [Trypanosoma grayi]